MTGVRVGAKSNQAWPQRSPPLVRDGRLTSHRFESCHGNDLIALGLATTSFPILFAVGADPAQVGLVASLNRPRGNGGSAAATGNGPVGPSKTAAARSPVWPAAHSSRREQ